MDVFYRANVTDGLFHEEWSMEDGRPHGGKFRLNESHHFVFFFFFFF